MITGKSEEIFTWMEKVEEVLDAQKEEFLKAKEQLRNFFKKSEEIQNLEIFQFLKNPTTTTSAKKTEKKVEKKEKKSEMPIQNKRGRKREGISLKEAILLVLKRPENAAGLTSTQIVETIDKEKIWQTNGKLAVQIGTNLHTMKSNGLVAREGKVYQIV